VEAPVQKSRCHWQITCCSFSKQHQVGGETLKPGGFWHPKNVSCVNMGLLWWNRQTIVRFYDMLILPDMNREVWRILGRVKSCFGRGISCFGMEAAKTTWRIRMAP
jgi:hypothetical protein